MNLYEQLRRNGTPRVSLSVRRNGTPRVSLSVSVCHECQKPVFMSFKMSTQGSNYIKYVFDNNPKKEWHTTKDIPTEYIDSISQNIMVDPVVASDGQTYEFNQLQRWIEMGNKKGPLSHIIIRDTVYPNVALRHIIADFVRLNGGMEKLKPLEWLPSEIGLGNFSKVEQMDMATGHPEATQYEHITGSGRFLATSYVYSGEEYPVIRIHHLLAGTTQFGNTYDIKRDKTQWNTVSSLQWHVFHNQTLLYVCTENGIFTYTTTAVFVERIFDSPTNSVAFPCNIGPAIPVDLKDEQYMVILTTKVDGKPSNLYTYSMKTGGLQTTTSLPVVKKIDRSSEYKLVTAVRDEVLVVTDKIHTKGWKIDYNGIMTEKSVYGKPTFGSSFDEHQSTFLDYHMKQAVQGSTKPDKLLSPERRGLNVVVSMSSHGRDLLLGVFDRSGMVITWSQGSENVISLKALMRYSDMSHWDSPAVQHLWLNATAHMAVDSNHISGYPMVYISIGLAVYRFAVRTMLPWEQL
jgi:hypothetical protein